MTKRLKVGVSAALRPGKSPHTQTFLRGMAAAIHLFPEVRDLSFSFADDGADKDEAREAAKRLVAESVDAVIGPFASECVISAAGFYAEAGIPMVTPAGTALLDDDIDNLFRICPSDRQLAADVARRIRARGLKRAAVYSQDSTHSKRFARHIEAALGDLLVEAGDEPDVLVYTGRLAASREWLKEKRAAGVQLPVLMTDDAAAPELLEGVADPGDVEVVGFPAPTQIPEAQGLIQLYRRHYGGELPIYFTESVTAAVTIARARKSGRSLTASLAAGGIETPLGSISFVDGERQGLRCAIWAIGRSGELRLEDRLAEAAAETGPVETEERVRLPG